jgi:hypothetical protein
MVNKCRDHVAAFIHKTGSAAQRKHDAILDHLFDGSPTDGQYITRSINYINNLPVHQDVKDLLMSALIKYVGGASKAVARSEIYSYAYVSAVLDADKALNARYGLWRPLSVLRRRYLINMAASLKLQRFTLNKLLTVNSNSSPLKIMDLLLTKTMPAHAPTAVIRDAA